MAFIGIIIRFSGYIKKRQKQKAAAFNQFFITAKKIKIFNLGDTKNTATQRIKKNF